MATVTYERLASTTLASSQASITFTSISQSYTDLRIVINALSTGTGDYNFYVTFNSDANNYNYNNMFSYQGGFSANPNASASGINIIGAEGVNSFASLWIFDLINYSNTSYRKSFLWENGSMNNTTDYTVLRGWGSWHNTSAVSSVTVAPTGTNLATGTVISIYGLAKA